jgi:segregation and condensation protein B
MEKQRIQGIVESLLFVSEKPLTTQRITDVFETECTVDDVESVLCELRDTYTNNELCGITLEQVADGWQLRTKEENQTWIKKLEVIKPIRVSQSALETLAIIAYKQPIIKAEVDKIRGVDSSHLVKTLMERNLIRICGRADLPGKPLLYSTTPEFLEIFGLNDLRDLPSLSEIQDMATRAAGDTGDYKEEINKSLRLIVEEGNGIDIVDDAEFDSEEVLKEMTDIGKELRVDIDLVQEKVDLVFEDACRKYATQRQKIHEPKND